MYSLSVVIQQLALFEVVMRPTIAVQKFPLASLAERGQIGVMVAAQIY